MTAVLAITHEPVDLLAATVILTLLAVAAWRSAR